MGVFKQVGVELEQTFIERYKDWEGKRQFEGTAERIERMYEELCWSQNKISSRLEQVFKVFEDGYDEMLVTPEIRVTTLCPHHILPCNFKVTIGYIPNGKVLGLSKFVRIAGIMGKRPVMQEEYSRELADLFMSRLQPKGVAVYVTGIHGCMTNRGVKQEIPVVTSVIRGVFEHQPETKAEFLAIARR